MTTKKLLVDGTRFDILAESYKRYVDNTLKKYKAHLKLPPSKRDPSDFSSVYIIPFFDFAISKAAAELEVFHASLSSLNFDYVSDAIFNFEGAVGYDVSNLLHNPRITSLASLDTATVDRLIRIADNMNTKNIINYLVLEKE